MVLVMLTYRSLYFEEGALHLAFFVIHKRQNLVEEFLAVTAEEFVVKHSRTSPVLKSDGGILDLSLVKTLRGSGINSLPQP
jgi:hypothetical protein